MGRLLLAAALALVCATAQAQQPAPQPPVALSLTVEQTQLIVQMLGSIGCQNVTQLIVCQKAVELLRDVREQAKAQVK